jgi:hypothetical protein
MDIQTQAAPSGLKSATLVNPTTPQYQDNGITNH